MKKHIYPNWDLIDYVNSNRRLDLISNGLWECLADPPGAMHRWFCPQMFDELMPTGQQRVMQRIQEQQMMAQGGGMPQGGGMGMPAPPAGGMNPGQPMGMPPMGGGGTSPIDQMIAQWQTMPTTTAQDMDAKAETIAQQIASLGPGPERSRTLRKLKQQDPTIHPFVKAKLEQMDQEMAYQGKQMMMQQQAGGM